MFLYAISTGLYYLLYFVVGYRKKVVRSNLMLVYPSKNKCEIHHLTQQTLRHFCDFLIEVLAFFSLSDEQLKKRYRCTDDRIIQHLKKQGKSFVILAGHYANWEWSGFLPTVINCPITALYAPVSNPHLNEIVVRGRARKKFDLVPNNQAIRIISKTMKNKEARGFLMISDQSPVAKKNNYDTTFLGKKVPVHTGAEVIARKYDLPVVFLRVKRVDRGYYEFAFEEICNDPNTLQKNQITETYLQKMEQMIRENPAFYLWTHRRFKHAKN